MKYRYRGVTYSSVEDLAKEYGIDERDALRMYDSGWKLSSIVEKSMGELDGKLVNNPDGYDGKGLVIEGNRFERFEDACEFYGVEVKEFYDRLFSGWSIYACLGMDKLPCSFYNTPFGMYYDGKIYKNMADVAKRAGTTNVTITGRIKGNWRIREVLGEVDRDTTYGKHNRVAITYDGTTYESMTEITNALRLNYNKFITSMRDGKSVEESVELSRMGLK